MRKRLRKTGLIETKVMKNEHNQEKLWPFEVERGIGD